MRPFCAVRGAKLCFPEPLRHVAFFNGIIPSVTRTGYMVKDEVMSMHTEGQDGFIELPRNVKTQSGFYIEDGIKQIGSAIDIELKVSFRPRPHQKRILDYMLDEKLTDIVVRMPCGAGKTVFAAMLISHFKLKTLIICPTTQLVEQFSKEIQEFTNGKWIIGRDIVVSTIQSAHKLKDEFDVIIADEAHTIAAEHWGEVVQRFSGKYRIALTATPFRSDGTSERMFAIFGQDLLIVTEKELEDCNLYAKPSVIVALFRNDNPVRYAMKYTDTGSLTQYYSTARTYNALAVNQSRQSFIATIVRKAEVKGRQTLTLYNRVKGIESLQALIKPLRPGIIRSKAKFAEELKRDHLIGISSMVTQGMNKKTLDTMIMASPFTSAGVLEQMYGRLTRPHGKPGLFFDIVDTDLTAATFGDRLLAAREAKSRGRKLTPLESGALKRIEFYKSKGMGVTIMADGKFYTLL